MPREEAERLPLGYTGVGIEAKRKVEEMQESLAEKWMGQGLMHI